MICFELQEHSHISPHPQNLSASNSLIKILSLTDNFSVLSLFQKCQDALTVQRQEHWTVGADMPGSRGFCTNTQFPS